MRTTTLLFAGLLLGSSSAAFSQTLITLSESRVIGGSPVFSAHKFDDGDSGYVAGNIFDQQTGTIDTSVTGQSGFTWFPSDSAGTTDRFVTIDLGAAYSLDKIELFNSNQADRGTGHFTLYASNTITDGGLAPSFVYNSTTYDSIALGDVLSGATTLISTTALTWDTDNPIGAQSFSISSTFAYRYLMLELDDPYDDIGDAVIAPGLAEVRIYSAVPEPNAFAALAGLFTLGTVALRRRPRRPTAV